MNSRLALITFMDDGSNRPDNSLPGGLPPGAVTLPVFPFDPTIDNTLPGSQPGMDNTLPGGRPERPDNTLPSGGHISGQPIVPGKKFVVKWLACVGLILVPDQSLPPTPEPK